MNELVTLRQENTELRTVVAQLNGVIEKLTMQLAKMNERMAELLVVAQRRQRKPGTTAAPAEPPRAPPALAPEAKLTYEGRPKPPEKPPEEKKDSKPRKPTGRKPLPSHLEAEEHALRADACGQCGSDVLDAAGVVVEEKLHVVKEHLRRRVVRRTTCRCRKCGARTTPRSLPAPYERSKVTCE